MNKIKLLLVDDHPIVREGIRTWLSSRPNMEIAGEASSGEEGLRKSKELSPDIVLIDISLPDMSGLEVARILHARFPQVKVIALTMHDSREYVIEMMRCGARGYVLKDVAPGELVRAVETVHAGDTYFSHSMSKNLADEFLREKAGESRPLSKRENDVLKLIAQGLTNKQISGKLSVSVRTVETHRENIMRKTNIHTVAGLTQFAIARGLIKLDK